MYCFYCAIFRAPPRRPKATGVADFSCQESAPPYTPRPFGGYPPFLRGNMYAVIKTGGKQYRVNKDQVLHVEKLGGNPGDKVSFDEVLMLGGDSPKIGQPVVKGAKVSAEIVRQGLGDKITIFKFRRRKNYRRKTGHRQPFTELKITGISG